MALYKRQPFTNFFGGRNITQEAYLLPEHHGGLHIKHKDGGYPVYCSQSCPMDRLLYSKATWKDLVRSVQIDDAVVVVELQTRGRWTLKQK